MSERSMAVSDKDLEKIGEYVESKLPQWLEKISYESGQNWLFHADRALFERVVRIEDELVSIERRMDERFEQVERRFEQIDKRFEQVDKRFEQVDKRFDEMRTDMNARFEDMNKRFTSTQWLIGIMITLFMALNTAVQLILAV